MEASTGSILSGMIFGSALTLSGVASPRVIKDQFRLIDFHMLVTFLTASASSAAVIAVHNSRTSARQIPARTDSSLGWIGKYDGNIIGGSMIGLGMALTGACPGTVLVQAAAGVGRSRLLLVSGIVAGIAFSKWKQSSTIHLPPSNMSNATVMSATGLSRRNTVIMYETIMIVAILTVLAFASRSTGLFHPIFGGLLIGAGQLSSVFLVNKTVGMSSAYEDIGSMALNAVSGESVKSLPHSLKFAAGVMAGSTLTILTVPSTLDVLFASEAPSLLSIIFGGFLLIFGARIAGGCTSGHGISGMAGMGLSSFISVAAMFGTGILTSLLIN